MLWQNFYEYKVASGNESCWPVIAPFDVELGEDGKTVVQPDLLIVCIEEGKDSHEESKEVIIDEKAFHTQVPKFVAEVISPSSRRRDLIIKLNKYMESGVEEYWAIDTAKKQVWVYNFTGEDLNAVFTFEDTIPVGITKGDLKIDFAELVKGLPWSAVKSVRAK